MPNFGNAYVPATAASGGRPPAHTRRTPRRRYVLRAVFAWSADAVIFAAITGAGLFGLVILPVFDAIGDIDIPLPGAIWTASGPLTSGQTGAGATAVAKARSRRS